MQFFLEVLIGGLLSGVMYSFVALGFVLIYKASGVFNFAQGIMVVFAALSLIGFYEILVGRLGIRQSRPSFLEPAAHRNDPRNQHDQREIGQRGGGALGQRLDGHEDLQAGIDQQTVGDMVAHRLAPVACAGGRKGRCGFVWFHHFVPLPDGR